MTDQLDNISPSEIALAEALQQIRQWPDPVLVSTASKIKVYDQALYQTTESMKTLMADAQGVGLAANQIGLLKQILVFQPNPDSAIEVLINPHIEYVSTKCAVMEESCLSIPTVTLPVSRPLFCRVSAQDLSGEQLSIEASGFEARVLQHEIDHLHGVLILKRVNSTLRRKAIKQLREFYQCSAQ